MLTRNLNTLYATPMHKLLDAAIRMRHHRKFGPGHEITFAIQDIDAALDEMGLTFEPAARDEKLERVGSLLQSFT